MNRRNFIKRGALWLPVIFIPKLIRAADLRSEMLKVQAWQKAHPASGSQAAAFFGNNLDGSGNMVTDSSTDTIANVMAWNTTTFNCPGTGTRVLDQLGVFANISGSDIARIALYTGAGAFVAQTGTITINSNTPQWWTASAFLDVAHNSLSPVNLTGGNAYILAIATGGGAAVHFKTIVGGAFNATDAVPNFYPATLPSPTTTNEEFGVRGHVAAV